MADVLEVRDPDRATAIAALAARTFPLACPPGTRREDIELFVAEHLSCGAFTRYVLDPGSTVTVAEESGGPVGYSLLVHDHEPEGPERASLRRHPTSLLSKFYVDPDRHGGGIASALMGQTLAAAERAGSASVWLGVNDQNARAIRFYTRMGFATVGTRSFTLGRDTHSDLVLERVLDPG